MLACKIKGICIWAGLRFRFGFKERGGREERETEVWVRISLKFKFSLKEMEDIGLGLVRVQFGSVIAFELWFEFKERNIEREGYIMGGKNDRGNFDFSCSYHPLSNQT